MDECIKGADHTQVGPTFIAQVVWETLRICRFMIIDDGGSQSSFLVIGSCISQETRQRAYLI